MFLVLTIISMAGLFVLLHAFFLAAVQVLVYAARHGVVPVRYHAARSQGRGTSQSQKARPRRRTDFHWRNRRIFLRSLLATQPSKNLTNPTAVGDTATLGKMLFTNYLLPFEIVSILLSWRWWV